MYSVELQQ